MPLCIFFKKIMLNMGDYDTILIPQKIVKFLARLQHSCKNAPISFIMSVCLCVRPSVHME
jgi:hypothetical protein